MEPLPSRPGSIPESERLLEIYRTWRQVGRERTRGWHRQAGFADITFGMLGLALIFFWPLDGALCSLRWPFAWHLGLARAAVPALAALALLCLASATSLHVGLSRATPDERCWPRWLRLARFVLAGLPLLGWYTAPAWRWVRQRHPEWAHRHTGQVVGGTAASWLRPAGSAIVRPRRPLNFFLLNMCLSVAAFAALLVADGALADAAATRPPLLFVSLPLHALCFALAVVYTATRAHRLGLPRAQRTVLLMACIGWLLPMPFAPLLWFIIVIALRIESPQSEAIVFNALLRRRQTGRLPVWLQLEEWLSDRWQGLGWWQRRRPPRPAIGPLDLSETASKLSTLYDLRSFALLGDSAALAWAMGWLAARLPADSGWLYALHALLLEVALTAFALALVVATLCALAAALRPPAGQRAPERHPVASAVAKSQLAALAGLWLGLLIYQGQRRPVALMVMYGSALLITLRGLALVLAPALPYRQRPRLDDLRCTLILLFSFEIAGGIELAVDVLSPLLAIWVLGTPVVALFTARTLLPWLLRPFTWRQAFSSELPARLRLRLALLGLGTVLPLGGLATPLCIVLRRRLSSDARMLAATPSSATGARACHGS